MPDPKRDDAMIRVRVDALAITEDDDPMRRESYPRLLASMRDSGGNIVPIFVGKPDARGMRLVYEGNTRVCAARELGQAEVLAIELEKPLSEIEMIEFAATHNGVRRVLAPEEWATKAERLMELTGCTQEEAARRLRRSASSLSRDLATVLIPEKHREKAKLLKPSARAIVATTRDPTVLDRLVEYGTTPKADGKLPSRDDILLLRKRLEGAGKPKRKPRALKGKFEGRTFQFAMGPNDHPGVIAEWLKALAARVAKAGAELPVEGLGFLFR